MFKVGAGVVGTNVGLDVGSFVAPTSVGLNDGAMVGE